MADLEVPKDVPWHLLCTSQDMMDPKFCNKSFPFPWRSSLAISAYEVPEEDLPEPFCNGRLTYVKLTLSITGYQPTDQEIEDAYVQFGNTPVEADLDDIFAEYFGCYGALLNVAFFPNSERSWQTKDFPRIIAMEPKVRELIQSATESGELLTATKSSLETTKANQTTKTNKTGIGAEVAVKIPGTEIEPKLNFTHEWGKTQEDTFQTVANASDERSEKEGHTTQLEQLYNFLAAYHQGTNRGVFLMLPRPHILQPTDRRTFVQGVRSIEGIQEFFLAVVRPADMEGICIEASLDTGHFPEDVRILPPLPNYREKTETFLIDKHVPNGGGPWGSGQQVSLNYTHTVASGWVVDQRTFPNPPFPKGDPGHIGVSDHTISQNSQGAPHNYNYQATSPTTVQVSGHIQSGTWGIGHGAIFHHLYTVYCRSIDEIESDFQNLHRISDLLITSRNLCCCFYKGAAACLIQGPVPPTPPTPVPDTTYSRIVEQRELKIPASLLSDPIAGKSLEPATKGLLRELKAIMSTSREGLFSHTNDGITYLQSDHFIKRVIAKYPKEIRDELLSNVPRLSPAVVDAFGSEGTVEEALSVTLAKFMARTGLDLSKSLDERQLLIDLIKR